MVNHQAPAGLRRQAPATSLPRVLLAAPASGQGKTTISVGIMAALAARGLDVAPAKVGPDFIDPGYHTLATGRPGRNLDPWMQGDDLVAPLLLHGALTPQTADVAVIEGVMGLFDGRLGTEGLASSAHVAKLTRTPVVLVVDISSASRSVAATVHGLRTFDPDVHVAGVILNKAGSPRHAAEVRRACEAIGVPVLGCLPRDAGVSVPSRHLGLVPAAERDSARAVLDHLAAQTAEHVDLDAVLAIARHAEPLDEQPWRPTLTAPSPDAGPRPVIAVAGGRAFTFRYAETDEMMRAAGLEPVVFDPVRDRRLPDGTRGIYLGGGFPEVHARALSSNTSLLTQLRDAVLAGVPTVAECAGMLYLLDAVDGHRFASALPAEAAMSPRLTLGYREVIAPTATLLAEVGERVRGHEFHRTQTTPEAGNDPAWMIDGRAEGFSASHGPSGRPTLHASYLHTHWAGTPQLAERFASAVHANPMTADSLVAEEAAVPLFSAAPDAGPHRGSGVRPTPPVDHHGDAELDGDLVDFAVNVRATTPPPSVTTALRAALSEVGRYPNPSAARAAVAQHHGVPESQVLLTNGAAEAFTLIARALMPERAVVVHPQFSEPDAALRRAGCSVRHHLLDVLTGATLDPSSVPEDADLVVIGNPTNPTGVLHPRDALQSLRRPGRVVVVDEAFMDLVPGERESLLSPADRTNLDGLLVVRSLTKTWALAGVRAGYVVGDSALIARLAAQQPHWSVNSLALAAMRETMTPAAQRDVARWAEETAGWRDHLVRSLRGLGLTPVASQAPFVLVRVGAGVHQALRDAGFATRRADTFPGLDDTWIRLAVRDPLTTDSLVRALSDVRQGAGMAS